MPHPSESFLDVVSRQGDLHPPKLVWDGSRPAGEWQRDFRAAVESLRGIVPPRVELEIEVVEEWQESDHRRILLRYRVNEISTAVAYLLVPADLREGDAPRPGVIVLHGHAKYGMDSVCGVRGMDDPANVCRAYALQAVRAGYVVLAPAWWGWAGRDGHLGPVGGRDRCNVIQMASGMYGLNVLDLHIEDGRAAFDVLSARPEVESGRIACIGNSYGGRTTMWLAVFEPRLRACVSSGAMNTFRERSLKLSSCAIQYLPGILQYGDVPEIYSLLAPCPLQLQSGECDPLITPADRDTIVSVVGAVYDGLGVSENFDYAQHPADHMLVWELAEPFLRRML
ncbi:MAG: dienelactone hydrolase family protein [Lentisphaeria bacterium]|nr:dienelactone hydrolase family protein [Lentisphaeria bacterium]